MTKKEKVEGKGGPKIGRRSGGDEAVELAIDDVQP